uniref:Uncharacterized protein n=1 Tax=Arundo donax TaxID=35708 RepID=A0A0A9DW00_ARUDO
MIVSIHNSNSRNIQFRALA